MGAVRAGWARPPAACAAEDRADTLIDHHRIPFVNLSIPQVRIAAAFYDTATGETVTVQDASRTHKRKHHINTLAMQVRCVGSGLGWGAWAVYIRSLYRVIIEMIDRQSLGQSINHYPPTLSPPTTHQP